MEKGNKEVKQFIQESYMLEKPYVMHYYIIGENIKIIYSNGIIETCPYSFQKEIELLQTVKKQATELDQLYKDQEAIKFSLKLTGVVDAIIGLTNAVVASLPNINIPAISVIGFGCTCFAGAIMANNYKEAKGRSIIANKFGYYMKNERAISSALAKEYFKKLGTGATVADAHNITFERINSYSLEQLQDYATRELKK